MPGSARGDRAELLKESSVSHTCQVSTILRSAGRWIEIASISSQNRPTTTSSAKPVTTSGALESRPFRSYFEHSTGGKGMECC
ncbi:hypothetical protein CJ177_19880 [Rhodococcus sp. ACPA1]|nr:hypothetical protein CJ177_19880 [Rhodococcus sp. ACPA1]